jgi:AraC-like DNA-binding protein
MVFSNETVALPLITGDPTLLETLRPFCDEATRARNRANGSVRASVESDVQRLLLHGQAHAETVAKALAVSVRTLSRRLSAEGTTFAEVVEQLRRSLALEYLEDSNYTTAQISWLLGYERSTSFNHAFKRWIGRTPSALRKKEAASRAGIDLTALGFENRVSRMNHKHSVHAPGSGLNDALDVKREQPSRLGDQRQTALRFRHGQRRHGLQNLSDHHRGRRRLLLGQGRIGGADEWR